MSKIKLAFSTVACPDWTLEQVAERAREMGYDGVELRTLGGGSSGLASDPALTEPGKVRDVLRAFGVAPACLSTSIALHMKDDSAGRAAHWETVKAIESAAKIGCPLVRVFAHEVEPGQNRAGVMQRIAERAAALMDTAGSHGVQLLFENAGSFAKAKEWWWILNVVDHPMVGLSWSPVNAAAAGEPVAVSVPMLNSRISLVKVKDTKIGEGSGFTLPGDGTVGIEKLVRRLMGIGFEGWLSVEWDRLWLPALKPAEDILPESAKRLRGWIAGIETAAADAEQPHLPPKSKPKPAKAAAAH